MENDDLLIDYQDALKRFNNRQDLLNITFECWLENESETFENLKNAIDSDNKKAIINYIHSIKGSAANISAIRLQKIAQKILDFYYEENWREGNLLYEELFYVFKLTQNELTDRFIFHAKRSIISFSVNNEEYYKMALNIRRKVFVEEQGISEKIEIDDYERISRHYLLFLDEKPVATARWRRTLEGVKIERMAVLKMYRNKGLGRSLIDRIIDDVSVLNIDVFLHAQIDVVDFYEKVGFVKTGEAFKEADIFHFKMKLKK